MTVGLGDASFFKAVPWLQHVLGITGKDLVTFMRHSVTVRLDDDSFFKALPRLQQVFDITGKNLVTFVGVSLAVRREADGVFKSIPRPQQVIGITSSSLVTSGPGRSDGMWTAYSSRANGGYRWSASRARTWSRHVCFRGGSSGRTASSRRSDG